MDVRGARGSACDRILCEAASWVFGLAAEQKGNRHSTAVLGYSTEEREGAVAPRTIKLPRKWYAKPEAGEERKVSRIWGPCIGWTGGLEISGGRKEVGFFDGPPSRLRLGTDGETFGGML